MNSSFLSINQWAMASMANGQIIGGYSDHPPFFRHNLIHLRFLEWQGRSHVHLSDAVAWPSNVNMHILPGSSWENESHKTWIS